MKRYITLLFLTVFTGVIYAQTADDALRYSQQHYTGTSRSMAMGGAFGALGGDFSSIGINPAGLGVYQSLMLRLLINSVDHSMSNLPRASFA